MLYVDGVLEMLCKFQLDFIIVGQLVGVDVVVFGFDDLDYRLVVGEGLWWFEGFFGFGDNGVMRFVYFGF